MCVNTQFQCIKMYKKLAVILAVAFVASARQVSGPEIVGDKVDDLLQKLEDIVDAGVANAREEFKVVEESTNKAATQAESEAANFTKYWSVYATGHIGQLKHEAKEAGVNIDDCLGKDEQTFLNLAASVLNDVETTVDGLLNQITDSINGGLSEIEKSTVEIAEIKDEIKDCRKSLKSETCLENLANKVEKEIVLLPKEITEEVNDVMHNIKNIKPKIQVAALGKIKEIQFHGRGLSMKIAHCVHQKINH